MLVTTVVWGHDLVQHSNPMPNGTIPAGALLPELRFNGRIDRVRSHLVIAPNQSSLSDGGRGSDQPVSLDEGAPANILRGTTPVTLQPGAYLLRWVVLSSDGHITRGEVPFRVVPER
jgi:copper resistance protein C